MIPTSNPHLQIKTLTTNEPHNDVVKSLIRSTSKQGKNIKIADQKPNCVSQHVMEYGSNTIPIPESEME